MSKEVREKLELPISVVVILGALVMYVSWDFYDFFGFSPIYSFIFSILTVTIVFLIIKKIIQLNDN